jgi:hypothetical protein
MRQTMSMRKKLYTHEHHEKITISPVGDTFSSNCMSLESNLACTASSSGITMDQVMYFRFAAPQEQSVQVHRNATTSSSACTYGQDDERACTCGNASTIVSTCTCGNASTSASACTCGSWLVDSAVNSSTAMDCGTISGCLDLFISAKVGMVAWTCSSSPKSCQGDTESSHLC